MDLHVSLEGRTDLSGQVYRQIREAITDGRLQPGALLPPTRELAQRLAVSRSTISVAYDALAADGYVTGRVGVGTTVSVDVRPRRRAQPVDSPLRSVPVWEQVSSPPDMSSVEAEFDFRTGIPDASHFPFAAWRARMADQLRPAAVKNGTHIDAAGDPRLRTEIARHVGVSRAVRATPDDVFVTNGTQQAIDLLARVLLQPGDVVAVEDPGYSPVQHAFRSLGMHVVGIPVDTDGMTVDALPDDARLVYVCPSHQYPLGMAMSLPRRHALVEWADRVNAVIVEDDYDSEFRYGGRPLEPLQNVDHTGRVIYVGSFSKVLLPTLRLGFLIAPPPLHDALRKAKHVTDWHSPAPTQATAAQFIEDGLLARHIRRMRVIYAERHQQVTSVLDRDFADHLTPIRSACGLHVAALLRHSVDSDDQAIIKRAARVGVVVHALSNFAVTGPARSGLILGYGAIPTDRIHEGLRRLRLCL